MAIANQGIVYAEGKAGTIQEIFQDAAKNYYNTFKYPMILFGVDYWTTQYPVVCILKDLFTSNFKRLVLVTDDVDDAAKFIKQFVPKRG